MTSNNSAWIIEPTNSCGREYIIFSEKKMTNQQSDVMMAQFMIDADPFIHNELAGEDVLLCQVIWNIDLFNSSNKESVDDDYSCVSVEEPFILLQKVV
jgi:hypothetical protein